MTPTARSAGWPAYALFAAVIVLFATRNLPWHLDNYDQAKQAFTSFEMIDQGHWWFQHTPTGRVATKPPLAGWISATLRQVMTWEFAWRLPSFVSALLLCALLFRTGEALSPRALGGFVAVGAFALNVFSPRLATLVRTDMLLTLFITVAGLLILRKARNRDPWTGRERLLLALVILGSMLTKGPIAYVFLLPGIVAFLCLSRRWQLGVHVWSGWSPWIAPLLAFGAWAWIGVASSGGIEGEFYQQVVRKEFLGRIDLSDNPVHKHQPIYFYLGHLLARFSPWTLILIALLATRDVRKRLRRDPVALWLICWALGGLIVMSLVPSKRFDRILPVVPPLCLLLPALARHLLPQAWPRISYRHAALAAGAMALLIACAYSAWNVVRGFKTDQRVLVRFGERVRVESARARERLAIVSGKDEGMLLYAQHPRFTRLSTALQRWRGGELDLLVLPHKAFERVKPELGRFEIVAEAPRRPEKSSGYVLLRPDRDRLRNAIVE